VGKKLASETSTNAEGGGFKWEKKKGVIKERHQPGKRRGHIRAKIIIHTDLSMKKRICVGGGNCTTAFSGREIEKAKKKKR